MSYRAIINNQRPVFYGAGLNALPGASGYGCCRGGTAMRQNISVLGTNGTSQIDPRFIMSGYMLPAGLVVIGAWLALKIMDSFAKTR